MTFRWTQHLAAGSDYDGDMVNERQPTADINLYSPCWDPSAATSPARRVLPVVLRD